MRLSVTRLKRTIDCFGAARKKRQRRRCIQPMAPTGTPLSTNGSTRLRCSKPLTSDVVRHVRRGERRLLHAVSLASSQRAASTEIRGGIQMCKCKSRRSVRRAVQGTCNAPCALPVSWESIRSLLPRLISRSSTHRSS